MLPFMPIISVSRGRFASLKSPRNLMGCSSIWTIYSNDSIGQHTSPLSSIGTFNNEAHRRDRPVGRCRLGRCSETVLNFVRAIANIKTYPRSHGAISVQGLRPDESSGKRFRSSQRPSGAFMDKTRMTACASVPFGTHNDSGTNYGNHFVWIPCDGNGTSIYLVLGSICKVRCSTWKCRLF